MSSGLECELFEPEPGKWYYVLQSYSCPVGAWEWREFAQSYGPFQNQDATEEHLRDNHANPGGYTVSAGSDFRMDDIYRKLISEAEDPSQSNRFRLRLRC
ncbi:hypothetical protein ACVIGB_000739 [Bradyrhizobium sp. USDA 4341]